MNCRFSDWRLFMMKPDRVILLLLTVCVLTVCCLVSCEEECDPCSPPPCPDPADRLIGLWMIFEAFLDGNPDPGSVGVGLDFRVNDTLIVSPYSDTLTWSATDDRIIIYDDAPPIAAVFDYYFEADTLDMSSESLGYTTRWRLLRFK